jgi:hypothetical protein
VRGVEDEGKDDGARVDGAHAPIVIDGRWYVKRPRERNISF